MEGLGGHTMSVELLKLASFCNLLQTAAGASKL